MKLPWHKPTELEVATRELRTLHDKRDLREVHNAIAFEISRLQALEARGTPFYRNPASQGRPRVLRVPVPVYEQDPVTGYPFVPATHYEQIAIPEDLRFENDPLFGWTADPFLPYTDAYISNGVNSFPRELFPQFAHTLRTQVAFDAVRWESRRFFELSPTYAGLINHIRNYVAGDGLDVSATSKENPDLAQAVTLYLQAFAQHRSNDLSTRILDSVLALLRDGEDFLRLYPTDDLPLLRPVDAGWVRGPHQEITGPWAMGIMTDWPRDHIEPLAYHIWYPDNTQEDVSPTQMFHAKLYSSTGGNTKRGVPLSYRMRKQLPQLSRLIDCLVLGESARQAIAYFKQYAIADKSAVQGSLNIRQPYGDNFFDHDHEIEPGTIEHINKGQQVVAPPVGQALTGESVYNMLCQVLAQAANVPLWFIQASTREETRSNALSSESPAMKMIIRLQSDVKAHYKRVCESAVGIGIAQGRFPADTLQAVQITCELQSPISRDLKAEIEVFTALTDKGVCSPQTLAQHFDLEFDDEREKIQQAEAAGWINTPEKQVLSERPTSTGGEKAAERDEQADITGEDTRFEGRRGKDISSLKATRVESTRPTDQFVIDTLARSHVAQHHKAAYAQDFRSAIGKIPAHIRDHIVARNPSVTLYDDPRVFAEKNPSAGPTGATSNFYKLSHDVDIVPNAPQQRFLHHVTLHELAHFIDMPVGKPLATSEDARAFLYHIVNAKNTGHQRMADIKTEHETNMSQGMPIEKADEIAEKRYGDAISEVKERSNMLSTVGGNLSHAYSDMPEWQSAHKEEAHRVSPYAARATPSESFAEFAAHAWGNKEPSVKAEARAMTPKMHAFFENHGLTHETAHNFNPPQASTGGAQPAMSTETPKLTLDTPPAP